MTERQGQHTVVCKITFTFCAAHNFFNSLLTGMPMIHKYQSRATSGIALWPCYFAERQISWLLFLSSSLRGCLITYGIVSEHDSHDSRECHVAAPEWLEARLYVVIKPNLRVHTCPARFDCLKINSSILDFHSSFGSWSMFALSKATITVP